jgi:hypothetical protein
VILLLDFFTKSKKLSLGVKKKSYIILLKPMPTGIPKKSLHLPLEKNRIIILIAKKLF